MFNLFLHPTQGEVMFVSMFAIDQQVNMSSCPIAFGSPTTAAFSGFRCMLYLLSQVYVLAFSQLRHCDALQCRTEAMLHNHFLFSTSVQQNSCFYLRSCRIFFYIFTLSVFVSDCCVFSAAYNHLMACEECDGQAYHGWKCVGGDDCCYCLP